MSIRTHCSPRILQIEKQAKRESENSSVKEFSLMLAAGFEDGKGATCKASGKSAKAKKWTF